jgi:hypothetical protein
MAHDDRTQPTEGDTGKAVIDSTGEEIGIVSAVEGGTIHVETDPGLTGNIKATLGWGDTEGTQSVEPVHVSEITDDAVHLGATDSTVTDVDDAEYGEGSDTTTDPTAETGTGTGHEDASTDRDDLPPEERRDDPIDGDLSGDETAAEMDDAGDPTTERTTGETGRDERGVPSGEDDPAGDAVGGMDGRDANERPPGAEDSAGRDDVQDAQLDELRGTEDVQDPVPEEPRDTEDIRENAEELNPESDADPEDQPSSAEATTRGAEEDADLGRDDDSDERSS